MSYKINFIGILMYILELMARLNKVNPVLNRDRTLTRPLLLYFLWVTIFIFLVTSSVFRIIGTNDSVK